MTSMTPEYAETLRRSGLVEGLRDLDGFQFELRNFRENASLCGHGDAASCMWIIHSGIVSVRVGSRTIALRQRGECVGEQALVVADGVRGADLVAMGGAVAALVIDRASIERHPDSATIWRNLARIISSKLSQATSERDEMKRQIDLNRAVLDRYVGPHVETAHALYGHEPQRRIVVMWFSDVVGFSKLTDKLDPNAAATLVNSFLTSQTEEIHRKSGHIAKFIGDAVMGFWATTSSTVAVTCERALDAARVARERVQAIMTDFGPLDVRIGLHVGEVLAGDFGTDARAQFTLIGREVNLAARLEQFRNFEGGAVPGGIRVSKQFYDALSDQNRKSLPRAGIADLKGMDKQEVFSTDS